MSSLLEQLARLVTDAFGISHDAAMKSVFAALGAIFSAIAAVVWGRARHLLRSQLAGVLRDLSAATSYRAALRGALRHTHVYNPAGGPVEVVDLAELYTPLRFADEGVGGQRHLSIQSALMGSQGRLLVIGAPGAGKTTLLRWMALLLAQRAHRSLGLRRPRIPFIVNWRDLQSDPADETMLAQIQRLTVPAGMRARVSPSFARTCLQAGRAMVMLDGLDEADENTAGQAATIVDDLVATYPNNLYVLTTRPAAAGRMPLSKFRKVRIEGFSDTDIRSYCARLQTAYGSRSAEKVATTDGPGPANADSSGSTLADALMADARLRDLATNPLMLTVMAIAHQRQHGLPHGRARLYHELSLAHIMSRDRDHATSQLRPPAIEALLGAMAHAMDEHESTSLDDRSALRLLQMELPRLGIALEPSVVLSAMADRVGVLRASTPYSYEFAAPVFQTYYAARYLCDRAIYHTQGEALGSTSSRWLETMELLAELGDPTSVLVTLLQREPVDSRILLLCGRILADAHRTVADDLWLTVADQLLSRAADAKKNPEASTVMHAMASSSGCPLRVRDLLTASFVDRPAESTSGVHIAVAGRTGFYTDQPDELLLAVSNLTNKTRSVSMRLEDTPRYSVLGEASSSERSVGPIPGGARETMAFRIKVAHRGEAALQIHIDDELYRDPSLSIWGVTDNPYFYGPPVEEGAGFFGRHAELDKILENVSGSGAPHTMVLGEQRSGKTSILNEVRRRNRDNCPTIYVSLSGMERSTERALEWLLHKLRTTLQSEYGLTLPDGPQQLTYPADFVERLKALVEALHDAGHRKGMVLLLDEGHIMTDLPPLFQEVLREALLQTSRPDQLRLVLAAYNRFRESIQATASPLQNIFQFVPLKPLAGTELRDLIVQPALRLGQSYEDAAVAAISRLSGGHPYYCQYLCAESFRAARQEGKDRITQPDVVRAESIVLATDEQRYKWAYWDELTADERKALAEIVGGGNATSIPKEILDRLADRSIITATDGMCRFTAELFATWTVDLARNSGLSVSAT